MYPGHTARQIHARIRGIPSSDVTVLAAGTNNIEHQTIDQCKNEISQIIDNVARKRDKMVVIMGQIPKRFDKPHLNSKIDSVNRHISEEISKRKRRYFMNIDLKTFDYKKRRSSFERDGNGEICTGLDPLNVWGVITNRGVFLRILSMSV